MSYPWGAMTNVNVGDSTKASTMNQAIANLLNLKSDVFMKTVDGDHTKVSQDTSVLREFTCSAGSGALFTLVSAKGDTTGQVMKGFSHGFTISAAGAFGVRDETQACWFVVWTEKGLFQRYEEPSSNSPYTAGGTPTFVCAAPTYGLLGGLTSGGSANAQTLDYDIPAYFTGLALEFIAGYTNTAATTVNVRGLGAKSVVLPNGTALSGGEIVAGCVPLIRYTGTNFILTNPIVASVGASAILGSTANNKLRMMSLNLVFTSGGATYTATSAQSTGYGFNVAGVQNSTTSGNFTAGGAGATVGSGGNAVTYSLSGDSKTLTVATSETITEIIGVFKSNNYGAYGGIASGGNLVLYNFVGNAGNFVPTLAPFSWDYAATAVGVSVSYGIYLNVLYVVGGAA